MFENCDTVPNTDSQRSSRTPLTNYNTNNRYFQRSHQEHAFGNHLRLPAFFSADPRIGSRRVNEANHGQAVLRRQSHFPHRFAISFGMSATKVAGLFLGERFPFLVTDNKDFMTINFRKSGEHGGVITKSLVAMEFDKFIKNKPQVVTRFWSVWMSRNFDGLPWVKIAEDLFLEISTFSTKLLNFFLRLLAQWCCFEVSNFVLEFINRFF